MEAASESVRAMFSEQQTIQDQRQRQLGISEEQLEQHIMRNIIHLLTHNPDLTFVNAHRQYLASINRERLDLSDEGQLKSSAEMFKGKLYAWLSAMYIPFTTQHPITIPSTVIEKALGRFRTAPDFFSAPNIPPEKLANAANELQLQDLDSVHALIDCTFWGSAKDCIAFGSRAVYFNNLDKFGFLPYSDFPDRTFFISSDTDVSLGRGLSLSTSGSNISASQVVAMLGDLKKEAIAREKHEASQVGIMALAGMQHLKEMLLSEVIAPLRDPEKYRRYGITIPNGILMYGPPGCGKTFVAQRLAAELNYNFYEVSPSAIGSPYVHESTLKIQQMFESAAASGPSLMFVDEFEGLVPSRSSLGGHQQHKAEEVNEWLVQIGSCADRRILFVAATNEPWSIDAAIQRSGRLDKKVYVGPPDVDAIREMLLFHLKGRLTTSDINVSGFAEEIGNVGYSASDLKLLVDEAAKIAMRLDTAISHKHLSSAAMEKVAPSISEALQKTYLGFAGR
jgi:ATP-dependent 26S proteasome regulatory subunit